MRLDNNVPKFAHVVPPDLARVRVVGYSHSNNKSYYRKRFRSRDCLSLST